MRILMMNHFPLEGSGSGIYTRNLAEALVSFGHEVMVIYPEHTPVIYSKFKCKPVIFASDKYGEGQAPEVPFDFPCFTSHPRSHYTFYEMSLPQIEAYIAIFTEKMNQAIESFHPDIIHAQHLWIMPYIASKSGIPYYVTAHGTDLKGYAKDDRFHQYAREGAQKAEKVITISKQVDQEVARIFGIDDAHRALILNGYNTELFRIQDVDKTALLNGFNITYHKEKIVFFAGKLAHFKGIDVLLRAAKKYENSFDEGVITLIAGSGELEKDLKQLKSELELQSVYFLGHIYQDVLSKLYNIADVSTVPSRTEPFGLVAIEALACGAPVVGTNQGGLPDFITDEVGALVPVEDAKALSEAIIDLIQRNEDGKMQKTCHEYAYEYFSREKSALKVEAIYGK